MAVATDLQKVVEDAAAHLYVWALKDIPQDLRDALAEAAETETSVPGQRVLQTILRNVEVAEEERNLVCQDTGIAVYYCRVGEHFPLHPARIYEALYDGTERATVEHPLRSNTVHTLTRENTGQNVGTACPSSTGTSWRTGTDSTSSASRRLRLREHELPEDVRSRRRRGGHQALRARLDRRRRREAVPARDRRRRHRRLGRLRDAPRQGGDCPSGRHRNADPLVAQLEDELKGSSTRPASARSGLGGDVTVLQCHVEHADTHMTLNPVAVNYQCWAARRAAVHIGADGAVDYDREA